MVNLFSEEKLEEMILEILQEELFYKYENGYEIERDFSKVILEEDFREALYELNLHLDSEIIEAAFRKVSYIDEGDLVKANLQFHKYLLEGVRIDVYGEDATARIVKLIDFERYENNSFKAVNQFTVQYKST